MKKVFFDNADVGAAAARFLVYHTSASGYCGFDNRACQIAGFVSLESGAMRCTLSSVQELRESIMAQPSKAYPSGGFYAEIALTREGRVHFAPSGYRVYQGQWSHPRFDAPRTIGKYRRYADDAGRYLKITAHTNGVLDIIVHDDVAEDCTTPDGVWEDVIAKIRAEYLENHGIICGIRAKDCKFPGEIIRDPEGGIIGCRIAD